MSRTFIIARRTLGRGTTFNDSFTTLTHFTTLMYVFLRFVFIIMATNPAGEGRRLLFGLEDVEISELADVEVR
jgi:hypothetical protein